MSRSITPERTQVISGVEAAFRPGLLYKNILKYTNKPEPMEDMDLNDRVLTSSLTNGTASFIRASADEPAVMVQDQKRGDYSMSHRS